MNHQPPIVLECPECGEQYLISQESYQPSENATIFSDGYYIDEKNWRTPLIIGCTTCELGFFPQQGKIIAEPDWLEFNERWSHIKKAEPPTAGSLALELRARKNMPPQIEKALRIEFWYSGIHSETGRILLSKNEKFKKFWNESLIQLLDLFSSATEEDILMKAEANRQLKRFDECIAILEDLKKPLSSLIKLQAENKNSDVFVVN